LSFKKIKKYIEGNYGCLVTGMTFNLSNRPLLKKDLALFDNFDAVVTELKAASVDIVTDFAIKSGKEVIYMNNIPRIIDNKKTFIKDLRDLYNKTKDEINR